VSDNLSIVNSNNKSITVKNNNSTIFYYESGFIRAKVKGQFFEKRVSTLFPVIQVSASPNPTYGLVRINIKAPSNTGSYYNASEEDLDAFQFTSLEVVNIYGERYYFSHNTGSSEFTFQIPWHYTGVCYLKLRYGGYKTLTKTIVKN
jgi:hypothetical protein